MNILRLIATGLIAAALVSCSTTTDRGAGKNASMSEVVTEAAAGTVLFQDSMAADWQEKWFLDGKQATLTHRDGGLYFAGGTVTKRQDPEAYHAHHAVLWTKQVFEGDLLIRYEMTRIDASDYGNTLLYIQAQGIGEPPYLADITAWNELREVPAMNKYFTYMSLISLSFRNNLRCKRYPLRDTAGEPYDGAVFTPFAEYDGIQPGKSYIVEIRKQNPNFTVTLHDAANGKFLATRTWDVSRNPEAQMPRLVEKGRIGLRHMATKQFVYRNFRVEQL